MKCKSTAVTSTTILGVAGERGKAKRCLRRTKRERHPSSEWHVSRSADKRTSCWAWWLHRSRSQPVAARPPTVRKEKQDRARTSLLAKESSSGQRRRLPERTLLM